MYRSLLVVEELEYRTQCEEVLANRQERSLLNLKREEIFPIV